MIKVRNLFTALILCIVVVVLTSGFVFAQNQLVSGKLNKLNDFVRIAVSSKNGDALVVWARASAKKNTWGRIYGADLTRKANGSYEIGDPFMISENKGSNQRPFVVYLPIADRYLVAWDTSYYDITEFQNWNFVTDKLKATKVLARTVTPLVAATPAPPASRLGDIFKINTDKKAPFAIHPCIIRLPMEMGAPGMGAEHVFITYFASQLKPGNYGLWGSFWNVSTAVGGETASDPAASVAGLTLNKAACIDPNVVSIISSGFLNEGYVYAGGLTFYPGFKSGEMGFYRIKPYSVELYRYTKTIEFNKTLPLHTHGDVYPLISNASVSPATNGSFRVVGLSNEKSMETIDYWLCPDGLRKHGYAIKKPDEMMFQRPFGYPNFLSFVIPAYTANGSYRVYDLYHTVKGQFRYREIDVVTGDFKGGSKKVFKTKKNRLKYMSVGVYDSDVLVAWSERKSDKRYQVFFNKFGLAK